MIETASDDIFQFQDWCPSISQFGPLEAINRVLSRMHVYPQVICIANLAVDIFCNVVRGFCNVARFVSLACRAGWANLADLQWRYTHLHHVFVQVNFADILPKGTRS